MESGPADLEFQSEYEAFETEVCQSMRSPAPSAPPPAATIHFPGFWELMELARGLINDPFYPEIHRRIHNARIAREKGDVQRFNRESKDVVARYLAECERRRQQESTLRTNVDNLAISLANSERKIQADKKASRKRKR